MIQITDRHDVRKMSFNLAGMYITKNYRICYRRSGMDQKKSFGGTILVSAE